jgi:membrane protease subunit (stomatin/prohibitin family)
MDIWKKLTGELIDIVEAPDNARDLLVYRFERYQNEIKNGAQLIVREGQAAVFVDQGKIADVFPPGRHVLATSNLPILSTIKGWKYGFNSPFKAEVYFVTTRQFVDLKWGTMNPVMLRDAEFGMVRLRAFGTYAFKCTDPGALIKEIVGASATFTAENISDQLRNFIVSRFSEGVAEAKIPALDIAANYSELATVLAKDVKEKLLAYGLDLTTLLIENVSLPPEVEQAMDRRTSMGVVGNLNQYAQFQAAEAMREAAKNPGAAGQMIGVGVGMGMGGQIAGAMGATQQPGAVPLPPPLPQSVSFFVAVNGAQQGPFDAASLARKASSGEISRDTLVWKQGMTQWTPAANVGELSSLFPPPPPQMPPPIPR